MGDERLRSLERDAARGDADARARLLHARVRVGELPPALLRLLAYAGSAPARRALGKQAPHAPESPREWVLGLEPWGPEPCVHAAAAVARVVLPGWEAAHHDRRPRRALEAVERWLVSPDGGAARECRALAEELWDAAPSGRGSGAWYVVAAAAWAPPPWRAAGAFGAARLVAEAAARSASLALGEDLPYYLEPGSVRPCLDRTSLREVVRGAVAAWATARYEPFSAS